MPRTKQFDEKEVLQKAKEVFWQKGYNGTSMDELVRATGLSRSSIYDTFGDKHGLFIRTIQLYQEDQQTFIADHLKNGATPKKKIQWLLHRLQQEILQDKDRKGCFLVNTVAELAGLDKEITALANKDIERMEEVMLSWIRQGQSTGEIGKKFPARALARHLQCSINGMRIAGQANPDRAMLDDIIKVSLSVLD
jgi:TetR/AcrR family transcriptional regulator, transcriptional repressor for nem operon